MKYHISRKQLMSGWVAGEMYQMIDERLWDTSYYKITDLFDNDKFDNIRDALNQVECYEIFYN